MAHQSMTIAAPRNFLEGRICIYSISRGNGDAGMNQRPPPRGQGSMTTQATEIETGSLEQTK